jgi:hypothetical protein
VLNDRMGRADLGAMLAQSMPSSHVQSRDFGVGGFTRSARAKLTARRDPYWTVALLRRRYRARSIRDPWDRPNRPG